MTKGTWVEVTQDLTSYNDVYIRVYYDGTAAVRNIDDVSLVYVASDPNKPAAPTFSLAAGKYWKEQSLELTTTVDKGIIYYTTGGSDPTTNGIVYSAAITISETTTVNACVKDSEGKYSDVVSRTYTFVPSIANSKETALTTTEAIALIDNTSAEQLLAEDQKVYVKGTVSKVDSYNSTYKSITYWLDDNAFEVYSGKGLDNADFSAETDVEVGAEVIVYGNIKKYGTTYEFDKNNYLVSYTAKVLSSVAISGSATKTSYEEGETFDFSGLTLTATYNNGSTMDITPSATWTASPSVITAETTQVEVIAKYGEKSDSKQIAVTVIKPEPVEGNSIIVASYGDNKFAAMTTELKTSYFASTEIFKYGDKYIVTGDINNVLFRTETAEGLTTIQLPSTGKYIQCTAAKNVSLSNTRYSWSNDGEKLTAGSYGSLQYNTGSPRFTTYENKVGQYAYIIDKADIVEGGVLTLSAKDGSDYYATFSSDKAVEFVDAEVYTVDVTGTKLVLNEVTSKQVPANEGVLIKTTATKALYKYIDEAVSLGSNNLLPSSLPMKESGYKYYKLAYGDWENKTGLGFYWGAENGAAFTPKAGGAYLIVSAESAAKAFTFGDEETAIESVEAEIASEEIFDLSGRKVSKAVKGLYIINGKKVVK